MQQQGEKPKMRYTGYRLQVSEDSIEDSIEYFVEKRAKKRQKRERETKEFQDKGGQAPLIIPPEVSQRGKRCFIRNIVV